ncbi:response regulator [Vibrio metschnikovii]
MHLSNLKTHPVDIVVSDVQMAGMGGLALLRNIKQHWPKCSGAINDRLCQYRRCRGGDERGAIDYMAKPFAPEVPLNMISRYAPVKSDDDGDAVVADEKA